MPIRMASAVFRDFQSRKRLCRVLTQYTAVLHRFQQVAESVFRIACADSARWRAWMS